MEKVFIILLAIIAILLIIVTVYDIKHQKLKDEIVDLNKDGKHFCNYCKCAFIMSRKDLAKRYCEFCGQPLTLHCDHPDFETEHHK